MYEENCNSAENHEQKVEKKKRNTIFLYKNIQHYQHTLLCKLTNTFNNIKKKS